MNSISRVISGKCVFYKGTPGASPYGGSYGDFNMVEANMKLR